MTIFLNFRDGCFMSGIFFNLMIQVEYFRNKYFEKLGAVQGNCRASKFSVLDILHQFGTKKDK